MHTDAVQSGEVLTPTALAGPADLLRRLEQLQQENEALGRELLRCYEQINLVFEITEKIAKLQDPETIKRALLQRFGAMIGAGALFLDCGDHFTPIELVDSLGHRLQLEPAPLQACLHEEIALVRETLRAFVPASVADDVLSAGPTAAPDVPARRAAEESAHEALGGAHVMLVPLRRQDAKPAVLVVLRDRSEPPFDSGDMLAAESVLGYGGQVLANVLMVRRLQETAVETVRALANAIDAKDKYTCGHSERVGWLARLTGAALGLPESELELLEWAGMLHDVGKIGIAEPILNKPGKLTEGEFEEMKRHPRLSYDVLKPVAQLGPVLNGVLCHHENWDGSGYPEGLAGERIPLAARIIRVVDTFDALTSTRSYRQGFSIDRAFRILREEAEKSTDPHVTHVFITTFRGYVRHQPENFQRRFAHIANAAACAEAPCHAAAPMGEEPCP